MKLIKSVHSRVKYKTKVTNKGKKSVQTSLVFALRENAKNNKKETKRKKFVHVDEFFPFALHR